MLLTPYFGYIILPHVDWPAQCLVQIKSKRNIQKEKIETDKRRKHFFHTFLYLLGEWTNHATSWDVAWCPKHQTAKWCCWFDGHSLTRLGSQKTWIFISLHRLQIRHSKILLILARPLPIGYFTFYYFSFFLIFNRMDAWSLMRGDAFIHFVCGSWRVNIRLEVLLLIPKSPQTLLKEFPVDIELTTLEQTRVCSLFAAIVYYVLSIDKFCCKEIFFYAKDSRISSFLVGHYTTKTNIVFFLSQ